MSTFKFEINTDLPVPPASAFGGERAKHPFPWDGMKPGHSFFIPIAYWIEKGWDPGKYTAIKAKDRVRASFKGWVAKDEAKRKALILRFEKVSGDNNDTAGIRVWLSK